jgi:hypothetical protein
MAPLPMSIVTDPGLEEETYNSPAAGTSSVPLINLVTPSPEHGGAQVGSTAPPLFPSAATSSSSFAGIVQRLRCKRPRVSTDRFSPGKEKPITQSAQYEKNELERRERRQPEREREAEELLHAAKWSKVNGKGKFIDLSRECGCLLAAATSRLVWMARSSFRTPYKRLLRSNTRPPRKVSSERRWHCVAASRCYQSVGAVEVGSRYNAHALL